MSANLDLSFEIHELDRSKASDLLAAAKKFLDDEGLREPQMMIDFLGQDGYLCGYSTSPVIIAGTSEWIPDVTKRWKAMAERINGGACRALVNVKYVDEP